jgi:hypothetical protein
MLKFTLEGSEVINKYWILTPQIIEKIFEVAEIG